ncbi:MAG: hypothetical protein R3F54_23185 [Alphaproteobacteria bacterium]
MTMERIVFIAALAMSIAHPVGAHVIANGTAANGCEGQSCLLGPISTEGLVREHSIVGTAQAVIGSDVGCARDDSEPSAIEAVILPSGAVLNLR